MSQKRMKVIEHWHGTTCSPFGIAAWSLKDEIFTAKVHNAIFQVEFPFISTPCNLKNTQKNNEKHNHM